MIFDALRFALLLVLTVLNGFVIAVAVFRMLGGRERIERNAKLALIAHAAYVIAFVFGSRRFEDGAMIVFYIALLYLLLGGGRGKWRRRAKRLLDSGLSAVNAAAWGREVAAARA